MTDNRPVAAICGLAGPDLRADERELFKQYPPAGIILFARNCVDPEQLSALTSDLRTFFADRWLPILIDQEGGRVQRLKPPNWPKFPAAGRIGALAQMDATSGISAARMHAGLIGQSLKALGIDVVCAPVLDVAQPDTTEAIGDRAFSDDPQLCAKLGRAAISGFRQSGVVPVIKHLPGHGRAQVDSHLELPKIDVALDEWRKTDAVPFVANAAVPLAMTGHILFEAIDKQRPATQSRLVISEIIRGEIGFAGLLLSDDLSMEALAGSIAERACKAIEAGCDLALHCNGRLDEMGEVLAALPRLGARRHAQLQALEPGCGEMIEAELADLEGLLAYA